MRVWCCDSDNRLVRIDSNNLFDNLSDSFTHSRALDIMVDLESNHGDENNLNNENDNSLILHIYIIIRKHYHIYFELIHAFYSWFWNNAK